MKRVISTITAALVAVSFSGLVLAADTVKTGTSSKTTATPAGEMKVEKKQVKKSSKKHMTHKKAAGKKVAAAPVAPAAKY
jgi:hypothetical protein